MSHPGHVSTGLWEERSWRGCLAQGGQKGPTATLVSHTLPAHSLGPGRWAEAQDGAAGPTSTAPAYRMWEPVQGWFGRWQC